MSRVVKLEDLVKWVKRNEAKHTWSFKKAFRGNGTLRAKYIRFHLDTRTMAIFRITCDGLGKEYVADFRDGSDSKTVLDILDDVLNVKES